MSIFELVSSSLSSSFMQLILCLLSTFMTLCIKLIYFKYIYEFEYKEPHFLSLQYTSEFEYKENLLSLEFSYEFEHKAPHFFSFKFIYELEQNNLTFCLLSTSMSLSCFLKPAISSFFCFSSLLLSATNCSSLFLSCSVDSW